MICIECLVCLVVPLAEGKKNNPDVRYEACSSLSCNYLRFKFQLCLCGSEARSDS